MRKFFLLVFCIYISVLNAQMVPHPDLLSKIRSGEIDIPHTMKNIAQLKERGVSQAWASDELKETNSKLNKEDVHRILGPAKKVTGTFNAIFLFVQFSDKVSKVSIEFFDTLLFGTEPGTMRDYYEKVSYGELDLTTVNMPSTIGWVTLPNTYSYYVDGQNGFGNFPRNAPGLTRDIVQMVDPIIDFAPYDNDGDGEIDALFIVHTGPGAEFSGNDNDIWSHAWSIPNGGYQTNDGVRASRYSMEPEYWSNPNDMTIGVYVHEMGHSVFGLPDVYDTDYSSEGVGDWSLMAGGSWNGALGAKPAWPDAWNHIQMGYVIPQNVTSDLIGENITAITTEPDVYKIWKNGVPGSEYFLVQNRQKQGYDVGLPASGLLIWHVDETQYSNANEWYPGHTNNGNYLLALEQADGRYDLEKNANSGDIRDPFPGFTNNTQFNFLSEPGSNSYNDLFTYVSVENISNSAETMTADLRISEPAEYIQIISPNGGESWQGNSERSIRWASNGINNISIELSIDNGASWNLIETNFNASIEELVWTIPNTPSENCLVRVKDLNNDELVDQSNRTFIITAAPNIQLVSPNGGESYTPGEQIEIKWNSVSVNSVRLQYSTNNGVNWSFIVPITPSDGSHLWTIPNKPSNQCLIRITEVPDGIVVTESESVFTINPLTSVKETVIPKEFSLAQNFPNPFNPTTSIEYSVPGNEYVSLKVFDILGNEVATLVNEQKAPGVYKIDFNASSLSSGIYFYKMQSGKFLKIKKLMLVK